MLAMDANIVIEYVYKKKSRNRIKNTSKKLE